MAEDYITRLVSNCLDDCASITRAHPELVHINKAIDKVYSGLQEPMQLAIVGRISSSKSTLVNAILGKADVVRTGHEAETFNVSWLKYGRDDEPMTVCFKDGTKVDVPRSTWANWASHSGEEELKTKVSYIEVKSSEEILKTINIIDTPGLDAASQIDSENTKAFLKQVNPDAVVFLFTKSLTEASLSLIADFQHSDVASTYSINPMNALGVLSKPDLNWNVLNDIDAIAASKDAISRTLSNRNDVRNTLFRILPVSALIGLASYDITEEEFQAFKLISCIQSKTDQMMMFMSADAFINSKVLKDLSSDCKRKMMQKYGLYGIHLATKLLRKSSETTISQLQGYLRENSGFSQFFDTLYSHFGDRARVIKAQKSMVSLFDACNKDNQSADPESQSVIDKVRKRVTSVQDDLHDLKEMALLNLIYEGKVKLENSFITEFKSVCGENGDGAYNRLCMPEQASIQTMIDSANKNSSKWRGMYVVARRISPPKANAYAILAKSYALIAKRLQEQRKDYDNAIRTISIYNRYVYGRTI